MSMCNLEGAGETRLAEKKAGKKDHKASQKLSYLKELTNKDIEISRQEANSFQACGFWQRTCSPYDFQVCGSCGRNCTEHCIP